jgi:hypothetical protein
MQIMNTKLTVSLDKVYGKEVVRPLSDNAKLLCQLAGTKTFTQQAINIAKNLGYEFDVCGFESQEFKF